MKNNLLRIILLFFLLHTMPYWLFAQNNFTEKDREMLINIQIQMAEVKVKLLEIDKRFEQVDKRFEQVDKRFEQVDKRFEIVSKQIESSFDQFMGFLWILAGLFTAITGLAIGFAYWDRRTMLKPVENEIKAVKKSVEELDKTTLEKVISALRELGKADIKVAQVLRQFNLL